MDLCYPLKHRSGKDDIELQYSLRGIEANLRIEVGQLFVFGFRPRFLAGGVCIPFTDDLDKALNLQAKYAAMCADDRISDPFLLLDDDHIFLQPTDDLRLRTWGSLPDHIEKHPGGNYGDNARSALALLRRLGLPEINYQVHFPMLIYKRTLRRVLAEAGDTPILMASPYGNMAGQPTLEVDHESKTYSMGDWADLRNGPFVSLNNNIMRFARLRDWLTQALPTPSRWERTT